MYVHDKNPRHSLIFSKLLEFKNLRGFSLTLKYGYYTHHADDFQGLSSLL